MTRRCNPRYPFTAAKSLNATARMLRRIYSAPRKRNPKERVFRIDFKGPDRDAYRLTNAPNLREAKREAASLIRSFPPGWSVKSVKLAYRVNPSFVFEHANLIPAKLRHLRWLAQQEKRDATMQIIRRKNPKLRPHVIERRAQRSAEGHREHTLRWFSLLPFKDRETLERWATATQRGKTEYDHVVGAQHREHAARGYKQPKRRKNPRRRRSASKRRARR